MNTQIVKYVIDVLNIKVESELALIEINNDINDMDYPKQFLTFLRDRMNVSGYEYQTGFQKFVILSKQYKQKEFEELNRTKIKKMGSAAERLANKVKEIDMMVLNAQNNNHQWDKFKLTTGEQYFTDKEIKALSTIGTVLHCVRLQRSVSGRDMLSERLEELFVERVVYPQLEAPKQSNNLIANLATAITVRR